MGISEGYILQENIDLVDGKFNPKKRVFVITKVLKEMSYVAVHDPKVEDFKIMVLVNKFIWKYYTKIENIN